MTLLYTLQKRNTWIILWIYSKYYDIWLENITPEMPIFQEENSVYGIKIPG